MRLLWLRRQLSDSYTLGTSLTVSGKPVIENLSLDADGLIPSYRITDIYGNAYWLSF